MFSPNVVSPSSVASRNPRRRQRNGSEDPTTFPPNPKRLRRSGLTQQTFALPSAQQANGHVEPPQGHGRVNGHTDASTQRDVAVDTTNLAVRSRSEKLSEKERRSSRNDSGKQLTKNDNYIVTQLSTTPDSLQNNQSSANWRGEIFSRLGYGLAITHEHVIVWRYSEERDFSTSPKPLKIKLPHPSVNSRQPLPLGLLIPSTGDPGLLIVMPNNGKVSYWENLSLAASPASDRHKHQCLHGTVGGMMSGEIIGSIAEGEPHGFVLTLNSGRVAHMTISDPQGKPSITTRFLRSDAAQASGLFGSLKSVFSTSGWKRDVAVVRPGISLHRGQRQLIVATTKGVFQIWDLDWKGTQSMVYEIDGKAQFLKALAEGGDIFHDRYDHHFEVLDFTFKPQELGSDAVSRTPGKGDCDLYVLTVLHGQDQSKYNLLELTINNGSLAVNVVHPISCYKSPLPLSQNLKPQVIVPEPGRTAFVVFEKSIVLVSLSKIGQTADDQMYLDANLYQDPFQDVLDFHKTKNYRSVACSADSAESKESPASCVVLVHGFGMIRVLAMPMPEVESARDRITVTARTKIEQAVFYGHLPQNLLDFSGRPEITFSQEQIESAAKEISLSIIKNTSSYIPRMMPSLEHQLQRRASALADLMKHLKQRREPLSRPARWHLLWHAEKLAAARSVWRNYQASKEKHLDEKQDILLEAIQCCDEDLKIENSPERHETDIVRHWFDHDIWRIEYLVPYIQHTVTVLEEDFKTAPHIHDEVTPTIHASWMAQANGLVLAVFETAFQFRQANANLYDVANETMVDGVLQRGFEELPEPWTATKELASRVEEQITDALKTYQDEKNKEEKLDKEMGEEMDEELILVLQKIQEDLPRQIEIWNQIHIEQFRWLKSRSDRESVAEGERLQRNYFNKRKEFFVALCEVADDGPAATSLAKKYADMAALVDIKDLERLIGLRDMNDPGTSRADRDLLRTGLEALEGHILSYFTKYGVHWSDVYFEKHLGNKEVHKIFEQSANYQQSLTAFLRRHPEHSKIRWINEVCAERNYLAAADSLQRSQQHENVLWYRKIELSMSKLALLAASQQTQVSDEDAKERIKQVDSSAAIVAIQEELYDYIRPALEAALDADAAADLAHEMYFGGLLKRQPYLLDCAKPDVKRLVSRQVLEPEDLIDTLTLIEEAANETENEEDFEQRRYLIDRRFFLALQVLKRSGYQTNEPARYELLEQIIWRRCITQNNWAAINQTENKDDEQVEAEIAETAYFKTLRELLANDPISTSSTPSPPAPSSCLEPGTSISSLRRSSRYATHADADLARLAKDMRFESLTLQKCIEKGRLEDRWQGIVEDARESLKDDAEERMERMGRRMGREGRGGEREMNGEGRGGG